MSRALICLALLLGFANGVGAEEAAGGGDSAAVEQMRQKLAALDWVKGPAQADVNGNSTLQIPEGYVFLDKANTRKFDELMQNLASGQEVMIAPRDLHWSAYLVFDESGYVKDDEKIDAPALLKTLQENTESANTERKRRGWSELHVQGWAVPPAYNSSTRRLEWATTLQSEGGTGVNFFTKILGRKGVTSVVLVAAPEQLAAATSDLNTVLTGYQFNAGETYAEYKPGDKIAEYGLAGLIVGGAAAAAAKTGLLKGLWKFLVAGAVAVSGWLRSLWAKRKANAS